MNHSRTVRPFCVNGEGVLYNKKGCSVFVSFRKNGTITYIVTYHMHRVKGHLSISSAYIHMYITPTAKCLAHMKIQDCLHSTVHLLQSACTVSQHCCNDTILVKLLLLLQLHCIPFICCLKFITLEVKVPTEQLQRVLLVQVTSPFLS